MAAAAQRASLQDDPQFQTWMGRVGDPGIVTMYASAEAPAVMMRMQRRMLGGMGGAPLSLPDATATMGPARAAQRLPDRLPVRLPDRPPVRLPLGGARPDALGMDDLWARLRSGSRSFASLKVRSAGAGFGAPGLGAGAGQMQRLAKNFQGMAAVLRFPDGAVEASVVSGGLAKGARPASAADVSTCRPPRPRFSLGLQDGWLDSLVTAVTPLVGGARDAAAAQAGRAADRAPAARGRRDPARRRVQRLRRLLAPT